MKDSNELRAKTNIENQILGHFIEIQLEKISIDLKSNFKILSSTPCDNGKKLLISIAASNINFNLVFDYHDGTFWLDGYKYDSGNIKYKILLKYTKIIRERQEPQFSR